MDQATDTSPGAAARRRGIPSRTLRDWRRRARQFRDPHRPIFSAFVEGAEGTHSLHRIVLAAIFVFGVMNGAGAGTLRLFLNLAGLAPWIACSERTLQRALGNMTNAIGEWGDRTGEKLGEAMRRGPERTLSLALDETWKRSMILVAMDVGSGFLLAEVHAAKRDAATWTSSMAKAIGNLPVKIAQVVADEAKGITAYVSGLLGAHRSSDLFHGLYEFGAVLLALHAKLKQAQTAADGTRAAQRAANGTGGETVARAEHAAQQGEVRRLRGRIEVVRECVRGLSDAFHPVDLATGERVEAATVCARMEQYIARISYAAEESDVRPTVLERIAKVRRLVPKWTATLLWWAKFEADALATLNLAEPVAILVRTLLLPEVYLAVRQEKASDAAERRALESVLASLRAKLAASPTWSALSSETQASLRAWCLWLVGHFVRASSCVEGHNRFLGQRCMAPHRRRHHHPER